MMIKKQIFLLVFILLTGNIYAQITVTDTDIIDVGDIIYQATDSIPGTMITPGNAGANQTWDFSSLQEMEVDTIEVLSPVGTPYESIHPDANMCIEIDDELMYLDKSSTGLEMVGYGDIPLNMLMIPLPLVYGLSQQNGPNTIMDTVFANMFIPDSLAPFISLNPAYDQVDSLKIIAIVTSDFNVDAWGEATIPMGTYDALRLQIEETTVTEFYAYCSSSLGLGGGWYPVPTQLFPSETEISNLYQWWANDPSVKFMLAELEVDSVNNVEFVTFLTNTQISSVSNLESIKVNVYPNPTSTDYITIELLDDQNASLKLIDALGKVVLEESFNYTTQLDMSVFAKGIYYLILKTDEQSVTKKIIVE